MTESEISDVLSLYPVGNLLKVTPAKGGLTNDNWFVDTDQGRYFLRRRNVAYTPKSVEFELDLVDHLAAAGFPTAPLVHTKEGKLWVQTGDRYWELYQYIPGERFDVKNISQVRSAAVLLAAFHRKVSRHLPDSCAAPDRRASLDQIGELLDRFDAEIRKRGLVGRLLAKPLAGFFRRQAELVVKGLQSIMGQPMVLIHGDFQPSNIIFKGNEAVSLLDFGDTALFYRAYDVAKALLRFSALRPGYSGQADICPRLDLVRFKAFIDAYQAEMPLSREEIEAIPALLRGMYLYDTAFFIGKESNLWRQASMIIQAFRFTRWLDRHTAELVKLMIQGS